jgi:hypothetical protein
MFLVHAVRYRCSYSRKVPRQDRVLAIKMKHSDFQHLLSLACVTHSNGSRLSAENRQKPVRVQWDPERSPNLQVFSYRSIRIGISSNINLKWINKWIISIEDVTENVHASRKAVDGGILDVKVLREKGLFPEERVYEVDERLRETLEMN